MIIETLVFVFLIIVFLYVISALIFGRSNDSLADEWSEEGDEKKERSRVERQLRTLQFRIEPLAFIGGVVVLAAIVFLLFLELFPDKLLLAAMAGAGFIFFAISLLRDLSGWRARKFEAQLVDAIDLMQAALQGGENPQHAMVITADASRGAIQAEFREIVKRLELGMSIEQSTERMVELYDTEGVRLFTQVLIAKWEAGGDLGVLLRSVNRIIRERVKLRVRMSGQMSGARYSAVMVALLPYVVIPFFLWKDPSWLETLSTHPKGPTFLFTAVALQLVGFFWLRKILRTDP